MPARQRDTRLPRTASSDGDRPGALDTPSPAAPDAVRSVRAGMAAYLRLALRLQRHAQSVTTARHAVDSALADAGVAAECRDDLMLALSEACGNAVEHARLGQDYEVIVTLDRTRCILEVIDSGVGLRRLDLHPTNGTALRGRGLRLINAITDGLEIRRVNPHGLAIRMIKNLAWTPDSPTPWTGPRHNAWTVVQP
jgi:serine/threonine-protein kinase RsbW